MGSGPAGLVVAAELATSGLHICVLESGEVNKRPYADALRHVLSDGLPIKENSRERGLGGSSSTWWGLSAPMDRIDLEPRNGREGWPLSLDELETFYVKASQRYGFPSREEFDIVPDSRERLFHHNASLAEKRFVGTRPPYRFALLAQGLRSSGVAVLTDMTVIECVSTPHGDHDEVSELVCASSRGEQCRIRARVVVLAAGGIENARLLLNSHSAIGNHALGNAHDQVGRYFMNHPKGYAGTIRLARALPAMSPYVPFIAKGRVTYSGIRLSEQVQQKQGVLNTYVGFEPHYGRFQQYALALWQRMPFLSSLVLRVIRVRTVGLRWYAEMDADPDNRVELTDELDAYGVRIPRVHARLRYRDTATLTALHAALKQACAADGAGVMQGIAEEAVAATTQDASHHLGTTCMGRDPHSSVVDSDCRVHGVSNLYVAGGSVFPTSGCANPTYTIVALSIRLAQHLDNLSKHAR